MGDGTEEGRGTCKVNRTQCLQQGGNRYTSTKPVDDDNIFEGTIRQGFALSLRALLFPCCPLVPACGRAHRGPPSPLRCYLYRGVCLQRPMNSFKEISGQPEQDQMEDRTDGT